MSLLPHIGRAGEREVKVPETGSEEDTGDPGTDGRSESSMQ